MPRALALLLASLLAAAPAAASGICDPERPETAAGDANAEAPAVPDAPEAPDAIVPCAMAENGLFGPACADAPVYVVTHNGVVLCQVSLGIVAPIGSSPELTARPVAPAPSSWSFAAPHAVASTAPRLPPPAVAAVPGCPVRVDGPPADVPPDEVWGPS